MPLVEDPVALILPRKAAGSTDLTPAAVLLLGAVNIARPWMLLM
jgi:hypothetical protein